MKVRDLAIETWSAFDSNRGRSALTVLGIVIGISAVIAMTSLIGGVNRALVGELGLSQAQLVYINLWIDRSLTFDDVDKIARDNADYEYVTATTWGNGDVTTGEKKADGSFQGVEPKYFKATGTKFLQGRPFTDGEVESGSMVVIINQNSVRTLYGSVDADVVGKSLRIGNDQYTIVGVTESQGMGYGDDESVEGFLPHTTMATRLTGSDYIDQIMGFAYEGTNMEELVTKTKNYLASAYNIPEDEREDNIYVYSMQSLIDSVNATTGSFSALMTAVASISLVVGGIGIMNMMLTNVTERIREIGLRKALGARRADIVRQFMLESICLCVAGGLIGVVLGYAGSFALTGLAAEALAGDASMEISPVIDLQTVAMATGICVATGIVFGWYPARRAARLDPVESLHYQ